jgi:hypothetical protein
LVDFGQDARNVFATKGRFCLGTAPPFAKGANGRPPKMILAERVVN